MVRAQVTKRHQPQFMNPIRAEAGERVSVGEESDEYPGWIWCHASNGRRGWVPEALLEALPGGIARLTEDYDAVELSVAEHDEVTVERRCAGWCWVRNHEGHGGWVPEELLTPA